jgi:multiple sugar transport system permease protein
MTEYNALTGEAIWIGLENYSNMLSDELFWKALTNTSLFTLGSVPITTAVALFMANSLNKKYVKLKEVFRAAYFMPSVTALVVIALIFTNLYSIDGYVNAIVKMLGFAGTERGWLAEPSSALLSIMAMDIWMASGYYMVLFLAGMQTIPNDLYEAAELNGASPIRQFWEITFPLLRPTLVFVLIINGIKSFQVFVEVFVMTKGGPLHSTTTLVYQVYENAFKESDLMGYASAIAYTLFIILIIFSILQMRILKEK